MSKQKRENKISRDDKKKERKGEMRLIAREKN
jgi:hypothetical protein